MESVSGPGLIVTVLLVFLASLVIGVSCRLVTRHRRLPRLVRPYPIALDAGRRPEPSRGKIRRAMGTPAPRRLQIRAP